MSTYRMSSETYNKFMLVYPFKLNGISHSNQLDEFISILRVFQEYFSFLFKF